MPLGTIKDGGILPRSLALIFSSLQGQLHPIPDLKPLLSNEVIWLDSKQVRQEEMKKLVLLNGGLQEVKCECPQRQGYRDKSLESFILIFFLDPSGRAFYLPEEECLY